ncbi:hypothetical protein BB560_000269 [Smittium megazygosporum]|uniref:Tr-type G domain-containing protein n=1 Tax=Smittium megazygosporum TaxID=133381 RepID=A0A2T9ZKV6_9FUNG|nr:hypothetical protein BB560_000269 [Smittium megazygosporum]
MLSFRRTLDLSFARQKHFSSLSRVSRAFSKQGQPIGSRSIISPYKDSKSTATLNNAPFNRFTVAQYRLFHSTSPRLIDVEKIRNVGIIAHVDHGKTTLVDSLLKQAGLLSENTLKSDSCVMDSNDLEKERGMTILSKVTSFMYKDHKINIVDTPGHADFGGEVERILSMVDSVILVTDATEGPMAQTKFVLTKALQRNLKPIVVMNKLDRSTSRAEDVESEILELFLALEATDEQLDYPTVYSSAKLSWATDSHENALSFVKNPPNKPCMEPLLDKVLDYSPHPKLDASGLEKSAPFKMLVTQIEPNSYLGKCCLGRIESGKVKVGDPVKALKPLGSEDNEPNSEPENGRVTKIVLKRGLETEELEEGTVGDIVLISGLKSASINYTICSPEVEEPLPFIPIDPPTISMNFSVNDSPLSGKEGTLLTSPLIRDRLMKEAETNIALQIVKGKSDAFEVRGRGELQLSVLIETMRREGFEISVSPPRVLLKKSGKSNDFSSVEEPIEEVVIDVDNEMSGIVIEKMTKRKAELKKYLDVANKARLIFHIPTRGLLGYLPELKNDTRGTGALTHSFLKYEPYKGPLEKSRKGALIATGPVGVATSYALNLIEQRGSLFISPGVQVYPGMIIGEYNKGSTDLEVNPTKTKQLTNIRTVHKDEKVTLTPVKPWTLEEAISYVNHDEKIEITPTKIRLRKAELDSGKRKQISRRRANDLDFID